MGIRLLTLAIACGLTLLAPAGLPATPEDRPETPPTDPLEPSRQEARSLLQAGDLAASRARWLAILEAVPGDPEALHDLAGIAAGSGDLEVALGRYRQLAELPDEKVDALFNSAILLARLGRDGEAFGILDQVLRDEPDYPRGWLLLGEIALRLGRIPDAERSFRNASELVPEDPAPFEGLAEVHARRQEGKAALQALRRAEELDPGDPERAEREGDLLAAQGRVKEAQVAYGRALAGLKTEDTVAAALHAARLASRIGNRGEASAAVERALRRNPFHEEAKRMARELGMRSPDPPVGLPDLFRPGSRDPSPAVLPAREARAGVAP